ncbi:unnamed protein product [Heterobilharzia americana]|nr:unnamed protein product [Heterobilharzia americana]
MIAENMSKPHAQDHRLSDGRRLSLSINMRQNKALNQPFTRTNELEQYFRIIPCIYPQQIFCFAACLLKWYRLESLRQEALLTVGTKSRNIDRHQTATEPTSEDELQGDENFEKEEETDKEPQESVTLKLLEQNIQTSVNRTNILVDTSSLQKVERKSQVSNEGEVIKEGDKEDDQPEGDGEEEAKEINESSITNAPPYGLVNKAPLIKINYTTAQEKRSTIKLVFDTMKYSAILEKLLDETSLFTKYPELRDEDTLVLVLCYDYTMRNFQCLTLPNGRVVLFPPGEETFKAVESCVQTMCTQLAACVARIRVRNQVTSLRHLLPEDWRKSEEITENMPLYGWYNQLLGKQEIVTKWLKENGFRRIMLGRLPQPNEYASDKHCSDVFVFNKQDMNRLIDSEIVIQKNLILQDKSSCLAVHCLLSNYTGGEEVLFVNCINIYSAIHLESLIGNKFPLIQPIPQIRCIRPFKEDEDVRLSLKMGSKATKNSNEDFLTLLANGDNNKFIRHIFIEASDTRCAVASPIEFIEIENEDPFVLQDMWTLPGNLVRENRRSRLIKKTSSLLRHALKFPGLHTVTILFHSDDIDETDDIVIKVVEATNRILLKEAETLAANNRGINTRTVFNIKIPIFSSFQEEIDSFNQGKPSIIAKNKFIRVQASSECNGFVIALLHKETIPLKSSDESKQESEVRKKSRKNTKGKLKGKKR